MRVTPMPLSSAIISLSSSGVKAARLASSGKSTVQESMKSGRVMGAYRLTCGSM